MYLTQLIITASSLSLEGRKSLARGTGRRRPFRHVNGWEEGERRAAAYLWPGKNPTSIPGGVGKKEEGQECAHGIAAALVGR